MRYLVKNAAIVGIRCYACPAPSTKCVWQFLSTVVLTSRIIDAAKIISRAHAFGVATPACKTFHTQHYLRSRAVALVGECQLVAL